ncbi:MAG: hypothetical protein K5917_07335 [Clostridiales bacterium]|nr:hypothetical protein [Clostridiales bacterium]
MNAKFKKIIAVLGAVAIVLSFAACKGKKDDETTTTEATTAETTEATTVADGETTAANGDATTAAAATSTPSTNAEILAAFKEVYKNSYAKVGPNVAEELIIPTIKIGGKENSMVTGIVNKVKNSLVKPGDKGNMPPATWTEQGFTNNGDSPLLESDIKSATYKDNGDGTATIKIVPKAGTNSSRGKDPQGRAFNVLGSAISTVVKSFESSGLKWTEGDSNSNVTLNYDGGYLEITYDTATKMMKKGYWEMIVNVNVTNASLIGIKVKSLGATITYKNTWN